MWSPISLKHLYDEIHKGESELIGELYNFWELVKIDPEKWEEDTHGKEGGGFWVVGIVGKRVIWYNDIEEGFNISDYRQYGKIDGYYCNQDELNWAVQKLHDLIKFGEDIIGRAGPPRPIN